MKYLVHLAKVHGRADSNSSRVVRGDDGWKEGNRRIDWQMMGGAGHDAALTEQQT